MTKKKIVTIGGGTGSFTVLSGIKNYSYEITSIVSTVDDGGSTGRLRDELGVLPPGDARQCLVALSKDSLALRKLFNYRFEGGDLKGHTLGNLIISALEKMNGDFSKGIEEAQKIFDIQGRVIPSGSGEAKLIMEFKNGQKLEGENKIYESSSIKQNEIKKIYLSSEEKANSKAIEKIKEADLVVICPGNIYCSLIPNFLAQGMPEVLRETSAKVAYVCNLVNKKGQTDGFDLDAYVDLLHKYIGRERINYVLYNTAKPSEETLIRYEKEGEELVGFEDKKKERNYKVIKADILSRSLKNKQKNDVLAAKRSLIRHDSNKLAIVLDYLARVEDVGNVIEEVV
ncbi:MAG: gluconeogenesis factor YvcK family protein [Patescibacteria group bacterium]